MTRTEHTGLTVPRFELEPGYSISTIINGCWQLSEGHGGNREPEAAIFRRFSELIDAGFTTFDCADIYTGVESLLGRFIQQHGSPQDIQIHTKYVPDLATLASVTISKVQATIDRSLSRLGVESLDLVQFHWWDYSIPAYLDVLEMLETLRLAGKIRHIGLTNFDSLRVGELAASGVRISSLQLQYSVLDRRPEKGMMDVCAEHNIALLTYGVLGGGLLNKKWLGQSMPVKDNRSIQKYLLVIEEAGGWEFFQMLLEQLDQIASTQESNISAIASRYIAGRNGVAATILGVGNSSRVKENLRAVNLVLSQQEISAIENVLAQGPILHGDVFELERMVTGRHAQNMKMNLNAESHK